MKFKYLSILFFSIAFLASSCRTEETELIETPPDETIEPGSVAVNLMQRTASNDGSVDNIIDYANCFTVALPVDVTVNGTSLTISSLDDLSLIESIFDASDTDVDTLVITYPITIILTDFTEVIIQNDAELANYASTCNGENESDDDIECLDFIYPISASIFNLNNELIDTLVFNDDSELYSFLQNISTTDIITLNFPIDVVLYDGSQMTLNNITELVNLIVNFSDSCDEDDDYDYNDDDCNSCTTNQFDDVITGCSNWYVDKLERDDQDYDDLYEDYLFNFLTDGTIVVAYDSNFYYGTWSSNGSGNNITVTIDIPSLPRCNLNWNLHEIETHSNETKVDLRLGDDNRLRYESTCN